MKQHIAFCTTEDGVRIAYATAGSGTPVIRASHWMTHLEQDFKNPIWRLLSVMQLTGMLG